MAIFKRNRLNMTWIESFPIPGTRAAICSSSSSSATRTSRGPAGQSPRWRKNALRLEVLGSYAQAEPIG